MAARVLLTSFAFALAAAAAVPARPAVPPGPRTPLHTQLISSEPAEDDTLANRPERILLLFSGPVQVSLSTIDLVGEEGEIALSVVEAPDTVNGLVAQLPSLSSGTYSVSWRTVSADGHAVSGHFNFTLALPKPPASLPEEKPEMGGDSGPGVPAGGPSQAEPGWPGFGAALRGMADGFLLAFAGLALFLGWLTPGAGSRPRRLARLFAWATPVALILAFGAWVASVLPGEVSAPGIAAALDTLPGRLGAVRIGLAVLALGALAGLGSVRASGVLALAAVLAGSGVGHAAAFQPLWSVPSKAIHLLGSSVWLGGLILLLSDEAEGQAFADRAGVVSTAALGSVIAIALTGATQTLLMVPELGLLLNTDWGTVLILKVIGLLALVGFGAYHRLRVLPRLAMEGGPSLRASVRWEALVMLAVIITAAFLSRITPPEAELGGPTAVAEQAVGR